MPANCRLVVLDGIRTVCTRSPAVTATRNRDFPITIKAGSSAVKIDKETKPYGGKRERLTFSSLEEAKTEARLKADPLARNQRCTPV